MPFLKGEPVYVVPARKNGVVLSETRGRYTVLIGENLQLRCREHELRPGKPPKHARAAAGSAVPERRSAATSIDLHGMSVDDALLKVEEAINECVLAGEEKLEVIHGVGSGRIRESLHIRLRDLPAVKKFRIDPSNHGVTWVYF